MEISFITDASYEPLAAGPPPMIERPALVPKLDFGKMQDNLTKI